MTSYKILAVNPGSTSTKISLFSGKEEVISDVRCHDIAVIQKFGNVMKQEDFRYQEILKVLEAHGIRLCDMDCVVGRGGLLRPLRGGTYLVEESMLEDLRSCRYGAHACNLGAPLARRLSGEKPAYIVDPVVVDELMPEARLSGLPELPRKSIFHTLNQKAVGRRAAKELGMEYEKSNFIIAHMGGGITVGAHCQGRVVDVNNGLNGEGPFSLDRAGTLPAGDFAQLCFSGNYTYDEVKEKLMGQGGLLAHLGTNDLREASNRILRGDVRAEHVVGAMAYSVAREIGARAVALEGKIHGIILTGGLAYGEYFVAQIRRRVDWLGKVLVYPGEEEMAALAQGGLRVLLGEEEPRQYKGEIL